ncbi:integrase [Arthrobacter sp. CAN_A212]
MSVSKMVRTIEEASAFHEEMEEATRTGIAPGITLTDYAVHVGDRYLRGVDMSSTGDLYETSLRLRVLPALGHLPVSMLTAGIIDRTIDQWEGTYSKSTIKNSLSSLVRLLDEAMRDDLIHRNPAKLRARRTARTVHDLVSPRVHAIKDPAALERLASECAKVHDSYADWVLLCALLSARGSEVSGLLVGDVDLELKRVRIQRQHYPGKGGLVIKRTKSRRTRIVPVFEPLVPVLERLTANRSPSERLVVGPRGGVLTTATVRKALSWDSLVTRLGLPGLRRHGLRHTGATWLADAGVPLHVLQEILGHESIETTRLYLHTNDDHLTAAVTSMDRRLSEWSRPGHSNQS